MKIAGSDCQLNWQKLKQLLNILTRACNVQCCPPESDTQFEKQIRKIVIVIANAKHSNKPTIEKSVTTRLSKHSK